jgi:DNA-binding NtrC family response regulator
VTQVQASGRRSRRALAVYTLTVTKGADRGKCLRVDRPSVRVGALPGNDLVLEDPAVSGLHLELSHDERGIRVRDLDSRNGTWLNGVLVAEAFLTGPARLSVGASELAFEPSTETVEPLASELDGFGPLLGQSPVMRELYAQLEGFARTDATVLIHGETGTGKELVAEALVQASPRAQGPLVVLDASALAPTLVESELFGHEKGAFTGAAGAKPGVFERAHGGTVFIDEVGELPLELQPRLLRVLERREVQRLGGQRPIAVDVRIIAASHRALEEEVNRGRFRADLFYRLSVLRVEVPPLRARREDIPLLVRHFADAAALALDERTMARLVEHPWPGNVRELKNAVERWKAGAEPLGARPLPQGGEVAEAERRATSLDEPFLLQKERLVAAFERDYAARLLEACGGNLAEGARLAGVTRMAIVKLLGRYGLGV